MSTTLSTREARVKAITDCIVDAHCAAYEPDGWRRNPHCPHDAMYSLWIREFNKELERIAEAVEKKRAEQYLAAGRLSDAEIEADLRDARAVRSALVRFWEAYRAAVELVMRKLLGGK